MLKTDNLNINNKIFQEDSLSSFLCFIAEITLSTGLKIIVCMKKLLLKIKHLVYIDDL